MCQIAEVGTAALGCPPSKARLLAHVERTLLSAAFDFDFALALAFDLALRAPKLYDPAFATAIRFASTVIAR